MPFFFTQFREFPGWHEEVKDQIRENKAEEEDVGFILMIMRVRFEFEGISRGLKRCHSSSYHSTYMRQAYHGVSENNN